MSRNRPGCRNSPLAHPLCSEAKTRGVEEQAGCWELPQSPGHGAALSRGNFGRLEGETLGSPKLPGPGLCVGAGQSLQEWPGTKGK